MKSLISCIIKKSHASSVMHSDNPSYRTGKGSVLKKNLENRKFLLDLCFVFMYIKGPFAFEP